MVKNISKANNAKNKGEEIADECFNKMDISKIGGERPIQNLQLKNKCGDVIYENNLEQFFLTCNFCTLRVCDLSLYSKHFLQEHLEEWINLNVQMKLEKVDILHKQNKTDEVLEGIQFNARDSTNNINKRNSSPDTIDFENEIISSANASFVNNTDKSEENLLCIICSKRFISIEKLLQHQEINNCNNLKGTYFTNSVKPKQKNMKENLECKYCNLKLKSQKLYTEHKKKCQFCKKNLPKNKVHIKFTKKELACEICGKQLPNISSLVRHKNCHLENSKRPFKCTDCGKGFNSIKHLENHRRIHDEPRIYECDFCFLKFDSTASKNEHHKKHSYQFKQLVDNIGKKLAVIQQIKNGNSENLALEINYNVPVGYWRCDLCYKMFKNSYKQEEHKRFHNQIKPFICEICGKGMVSQQVLNYHMLVHKKERRFKCPKCGNRFFTSAHLKRHIQTTCNNEKLFQCEICHYRFTRKEHLIAHSLTHDKNRTKDYKCEYCNAGYLTSNSLRVHKKKHIVNLDGPFKCSFCSAEFSNKDAVRRHEKRHENKGAYKCDYCVRSFNDKVDMQQHMKRQHFNEIKTFICTTCNKYCFKKFDLEEHLKTHYTS